jgi:translation elongation factor EF-Tu-like GTPase
MITYIKIQARMEFWPGEHLRRHPVKNGYRPVFNFDGSKNGVTGRVDLINTKTINEGTTVDIRITFVTGSIADKFLFAGNIFTVSEGAMLIGKGKIVQVISLNSHLPPYVDS